MYEDENYVLEAMLAGARGYVQKSAIDTELFQAIENVAAGRLHLNERSAKSVLAMLLVERQKADAGPVVAALSPREQEVLRLYARGFSLREIGEQLGLSVKTIDTYKTRLMDKLGFSKKNELIAYAVKLGFFDTDQ
jgi:DNA-binding NarL/FixJ family response regulator